MLYSNETVSSGPNFMWLCMSEELVLFSFSIYMIQFISESSSVLSRYICAMTPMPMKVSVARVDICLISYVFVTLAMKCKPYGRYELLKLSSVQIPNKQDK